MKRRFAVLMAVALLAPLSASAVSVDFDRYDNGAVVLSGHSINFGVSHDAGEATLFDLMGLTNYQEIADNYYLEITTPYTQNSAMTVLAIEAMNDQELGWYAAGDTTDRHEVITLVVAQSSPRDRLPLIPMRTTACICRVLPAVARTGSRITTTTLTVSMALSA